MVDNSYAAEAGLEYGDEIIAVDGRTVSDWEGALVGILESMVDDGRIELSVEGDDGRQRSAVIDVGDDSARLTEPGVLFDGLGLTPWQPPAVAASSRAVLLRVRPCVRATVSLPSTASRL